MAGHLDRWAASSLTDSVAWESALVGSHMWLEFAPRNQLLLLSYGISGPAAGAETWRFVESAEGRGCGVRAGEHGFPVRVPITTGGVEPDPFVGGTRPSRSMVERWEWRPVFSVEQLARKPLPDSLARSEPPPTLAGESGPAEFTAAVGRVAAATMRGRAPKSTDAHKMLAEAAGRLKRSADRSDLLPTLREQAAWLVAERVGHAPTERPLAFDPSRAKPRDRWEYLLDVLDPARRLTATLGVTVGVDLVASPLPRMQILDDRVVPAGRRHRIPPATFESLPVGRWVPVGPYTAAEWLARGEIASGKGAFLRLNKSAYVVAAENGDGVSWRLEDIAARTGHGRLAMGQSADLESVRQDVAEALEGRYPAIAQSIEPAEDGGQARLFEGGPVRFDYAIAAYADSDSYSRAGLAELLGPKVSVTDRGSLVSADFEGLARIVTSAGLTPATVVAVLHADRCPPDAAAGLMPTIGVPMSDAIRGLEGRWDLTKTSAADLLDATGDDMRAAGCSATEILALRPDAVLRTLPPETHLWELAATTMATAGHSPPVIVGHLREHAPTAELFAAALATAIDDPAIGLGLASRLRAQPGFIAAASERYGLTPAETAGILRAENAPTSQALAVLGHRCDFDDTAVHKAWTGTIDAPDAVAPVAVAGRITSVGGTEIGTAAELVALLPPIVRPGGIAPTLDITDVAAEFPELHLETSSP